MKIPDKNTIDEFISALQVSIKSKIVEYDADVFSETLLIQFQRKPLDDPQWALFEKIVGDNGRWAPRLKGYSIDTAVITSHLINFLLITRLKEENIAKLGKIDPKYRDYVERAVGSSGLQTGAHALETLVQISGTIFSISEQNGITIRQLAEQTNLSMVSISNFKAGKDIRLSNFLKIAAALGLKLKLQ